MSNMLEYYRENKSDLYDLTGLGTPDKILLMLTRMLPDYIFDNAQYEGNTATLPEVMTIIEGITVNGLTLKESHMIEDLKLGWDYVIDCIKENKECTIKQLHARLAYKLLGSSGTFRMENVRMQGAENYICPNAVKLDNIYISIIPSKFTARALIKFYCDLVYNQFFEDCNKRTARIFINYYLVKNGIGIFNISRKLKKEYNDHLIEMMNTGEQDAMVEWLLDKCMMYFIGDEWIDFGK